MSKEVMKQALEKIATVNAMDYEYQRWAREALAIVESEKQKPVQVSPLDFVEMVIEKEHLVGKPIVWAQWPNKEKS